MADRAQPDPLVEVLSRLVSDGTLTDGQARTVDEALRTAGVVHTEAPPQRQGTATAVEVLTYLGAALAVGALTLVVGLSWDQLGQTGQILVCAAITVLFLALAVAVSVWRTSVFQHRRRTVASVLAALATVGAALTTIQVADLVGTVDGSWTSVAIGGIVFACGVGAYAAWRGAPSVLVMFAGGATVVGGVLDLAITDAADYDASTYYALTYYGYGALWVLGGRLLRNPHTAGVLGGLLALGTTEFLAFEESWLGFVLGLVAVAGMFTLFWYAKRWWYAALGVLGALVVPATAVGQLWSGALAAGVLLVVGVLLVTVALVLARTRRRSPSA